MIRQITERQVALNQLKDSEEKYRFLTENANEAFVTADRTGGIVDVNPSAELMFGYSKSELRGQNLTLLMPKKFLEENGPRAFSRFLELTNAKEGINAVELYARKKDGVEFPVEVSVSAWETKEGAFYTAITRDITDRKFFMRTLLKNEHRLFQFLEAVPVGILVWDKTGMPYYTNQTAKGLLGRDILKDVAALDKNSQVYPLHLMGTDKPYPAEKLPVTRAMRGEKSFVDDMEIRQPGKTIPVHSWGTPIFDENGEIKYGLVALIDMAHQKEITESLQSREEFFRNLFEEGPIGMTLAFPDTTYVNVNRAFCDMLGYPKDRIIGKSFLDFTHPDDIEAEKMLSKKMFDKLIPKYQVEKRLMTSKGQTIWCRLSASLIRDMNDEPMFRLAIIENITDQKEAELALKANEGKFRAVTESANDAIVSTDGHGNIIYLNQAAIRLFGHTLREIYKRPFFIFMPERTYKERAGEFRIAFAGGTSPLVGRSTEWTGLTKDGREFPLELSLYTWFTDQGVFATAVMRDITERKQLEEMKNDLISVVSHQLKTPVAEINGYIENMLEGLAGELSGKQRQYLLDMKEIGMDNYRLIYDLLNLSKIERGVITVTPKPISLHPLIETAFRDYESVIYKKGLNLVINSIPDDIQVMVDKDKTVETLRNIISNAVKCTDKGSITVSVRDEDGFEIVEISDTGIGMDPEALKKLFTKERVLGAESSRSGAGLGLYIAKSFMNLQGGDISVKSKRKEGSVFSVKLPLAKERA